MVALLSTMAGRPAVLARLRLRVERGDLAAVLLAVSAGDHLAPVIPNLSPMTNLQAPLIMPVAMGQPLARALSYGSRLPADSNHRSKPALSPAPRPRGPAPAPRHRPKCPVLHRHRERRQDGDLERRATPGRRNHETRPRASVAK
jgi:hypothetical protein